MAEDIESRLARIEERLTYIAQQLGAPPGLVVRVDRLEQAEGRRSRFVWLALGAALTALGKALLPL